jgi:predicted membrane protein
MNVQETQFLYGEEQIVKGKRGYSWFAMLLVLLSIPLIILGIGLLIFAIVTIAGVVFLILTVLLLVVGVSILIASGVYLVNSTDRVETHRFSVNGHPHIVVNNEVGAIHIKANSDANTVTFQTKRHTRRIGKASNESWVSYEQLNEGNEIRADVERVYSPNINLPQSIDFNITVPHNAELELNTSVGDIWVTGICGQLSVQSDIGSIYVKEGLLTGNSVLKTNLGSVNFHEAIDPYGSYQLATETGSVNVILPDDTPFELDASTNFGNITTVVPHMKMAYRTSCEVHGDAGIPPRASLKVSSITGSVSVFEESDGHIPNWGES